MLTSEPLLGRDRELAVLGDAVAAAAGHGSTLLLTGEPGIGKSALLAAARVMAVGAGYQVLYASGVESEMHLPFGGIHQLLLPLMGQLAALSKAHRDAVATAFGLADGERPDLFLIAEAALAFVLRERVDRPLVLVVDDVQWLDPQSHQILTFVAHRGALAGVTVIAASRAGHPGPFVAAGFPELEVDGLDDDAAGRILHAHRAGTELTATQLAQVQREAQGNPLALLELPRSWADGPPAAGQAQAMTARLEHAFAGRVSELPAATRDVLLVAAVGSSSDTAEILAAAAAFGTPAPSRRLLAPAIEAGLVADDGSHVTFHHPLVRSGVLHREPLERRHGAHAALADVLDTDRYRRAWHRAWSIVGPDDDVADALVATVPDSLRRGAVLSAVAGLERAAQLTSSSALRGERLVLAAGRAFEAGRPDLVARLVREAGDVDLSELDQVRLTWLTEVLNDDVRADPELVRHLRVSAARAEALGDHGLALDLLLAAGLRCWWADSGADERAGIVRVLDAMTAARVDPRHLAALSITEPVLRGCEVASALAGAPLDAVRDGHSLRLFGMAAYGIGDLASATDLLDRAEAVFRAEGRLGMLPVVLALQLHIRLDLGDWSGADLAAREVVTISRETGQAVFADNNVLVEARALALRGDWRGALAVMTEAEATAERLGVDDRICLAYQARGTALLSADRPAEAFECLRRQYLRGDPGCHERESFAGVALLAEAAVAAEHVDEARTIVEGLDLVSAVTPSPLLTVNLLYARAVLAPADVRDDAYRAALAHDLARWPWLRARLQLAFAGWLVATDREAEAVAPLAAAIAVLEQLDAARWLRHARRLSAGIDHRRAGSS